MQYTYMHGYPGGKTEGKTMLAGPFIHWFEANQLLWSCQQSAWNDGGFGRSFSTGSYPE